MKKFFSMAFACMVGVVMAGFLFALVGLISLVGIIASSDTEYEPKPHTILHIDLGTVTERDQEDIMSLLSGEQESAANGLDEIIKAIQIAKTDENIVGIYIDANGVSAGIATIDRIHRELADFKKSGKFIYAYADNYSQREYLLSAVADKVILNPVGSLDFRGLCSEVTFYKGLTDKLGVEMQILKVGTYKSAVEPYIGTEMSEANREQTQAYITPIWNHLLTQLSQDRNIPVARLNQLADTLLMTVEPQFLVSSKLVDKLMYRPQMEEFLKGEAGIEQDDDIIFASVSEVVSIKQPKNKAKEQIAIVYAEGGIDMGESNGINTKELVKELIEIKNDDDIKALILRVNSPGGSAYGSEQVWAAIEEIKAAGKPVAVSMGDVAASGGYYISCNANRIFAEPTTLTGSIGIYGMIPNIEGLITNKLGVTFDQVQTNKYGNFPAINRPMTPDERRQMQLYIDRGYELFTRRCAEGRGMSIESIKKIAEGRVWDGSTALKIGLVDELGDLDNAVAWAAQKAELDKYKIVTYPKPKSTSEQLMELFNAQAKTKTIQEHLGDNYRFFNVLQQIQALDPLQCRMEDITLY